MIRAKNSSLLFSKLIKKKTYFNPTHLYQIELYIVKQAKVSWVENGFIWPLFYGLNLIDLGVQCVFL